jgi:hypothetical protein
MLLWRALASARALPVAKGYGDTRNMEWLCVEAQAWCPPTHSTRGNDVATRLLLPGAARRCVGEGRGRSL